MKQGLLYMPGVASAPGLSIGGRDVNNEFWMPSPSGPVERFEYVYERLTRQEQAVLHRLLRGESPRKAARRLGRWRQRAAIRRRRRALDRLGIHDIRSLVQIVIELGL